MLTISKTSLGPASRVCVSVIKPAKDIASINPKEILQRREILFKGRQEEKYNLSYREFLRFFENKENITTSDLIIAANFTYGWMPTILDFKARNFAECAQILDRSRAEKLLEDEELLRLARLINNSLVGTSKLLHFANPEVYPIWDSRVCKFLTGTTYPVNRFLVFRAYVDLCLRVIEFDGLQDAREKYVQYIGFTVTPIRTLEQVMFLSSDNPLR